MAHCNYTTIQKISCDSFQGNEAAEGSGRGAEGAGGGQQMGRVQSGFTPAWNGAVRNPALFKT